MLEYKKEDNPYLLNHDTGKVDSEFRNLLMWNDRLYNFRVGYVLSYSDKEDYYKIEIFPSRCNPRFNSREYFINNFERGKGEEKLAEFANSNNVRLITY